MSAEPLPEYLEDIARSLPLTLTIEHACEVLHLSRSSVSRLVNSGALHSVRSVASRSSRVIIPRSEIIRWLVAHSR